MQFLGELLSSENLNTEVVSGVSLAFALIFFGPLLLVALCFWLYCAFARTSPIRVAKALSILWLVACVPAALLILMGYAFSPGKLNPLIVLPFWIVLGLLPLWLPIGLRRVLGMDASRGADPTSA